ncbi:MAG: radical SAM protein [Promethearchaeota archaeon]
MEIKYQAIKNRSKVLNLYPTTESWFWVRGSINPFRGCEHNCTYCDGKAEWYKIEKFGNLIRIKIDAPQRYEKELLAMGYRPEYRPKDNTLEAFLPDIRNKKPIKAESKPHFPIAVGGGVCDVYQPAEKKFNVTRQILMKSRDFGVPVMILTKSNLVLRDLDVLSEINDLNYANISFSITLFNEEVKRIFEPKSASTLRRFEALNIIRQNKIPGGIMLMPILPGIGDTEENLKNIVKRAKEVGAEFIIPGGLTLKPGKNKQEYLGVVRRHFPDLMPLYQDLYRDNKYGSPNSKKMLNACKIVHELCKQYHLSDRIPRYIPPGVHKKNFLVSTVLYNLAYYYQWVSEKQWKFSSPFTKGANVIESLSFDMSKMKRNELRNRIKLHREVFSVVLEILETGTSTALLEYQDPKTIFHE